MIRGTTPTHIFKLPFATDVLEEIMILYVQNGEEILQKNIADVTLGTDTISLTLTQEETFLFDHKKNVQIQLRVKTTAGNVLASSIMVVRVEECLSEEVL